MMWEAQHTTVCAPVPEASVAEPTTIDNNTSMVPPRYARSWNDVDDDRLLSTTNLPVQPVAQYTSLQQPVSTVKAYPDNQANCTVVNSLEHLIDPTPLRMTASTASESPAVATHYGLVRLGIRDENMRTAAFTTTAVCIPTQPKILVGTNIMDQRVHFNTTNGDMKCVVGDVSVPVEFNGMYSLDLVVNPPWPDTVMPTVTAQPVQDIQQSKSSVNTRTDKPHCVHGQHAVLNNRPITVVDYFAGVGHTSIGLPAGYDTVAYVDKDVTAAAAFADRHPDVPQWRDIHDVMQLPSFDAVASTADVAFVGAPCADHSILIRNVMETLPEHA